MNIELLTFGEYGQFIWPAFIFTFLVCFSLYVKTKQELQRQEKIFLNEFKQSKNIKIETGKIKESTREVLSNFNLSI